MPKRKDISNDLREAIAAAHQSEKGYKVISKQFGVIHEMKTFKTVTNRPRSGRPSKIILRSDHVM